MLSMTLLTSHDSSYHNTVASSERSSVVEPLTLPDIALSPMGWEAGRGVRGEHRQYLVPWANIRLAGRPTTRMPKGSYQGIHIAPAQRMSGFAEVLRILCFSVSCSILFPSLLPCVRGGYGIPRYPGNRDVRHNGGYSDYKRQNGNQQVPTPSHSLIRPRCQAGPVAYMSQCC